MRQTRVSDKQRQGGALGEGGKFPSAPFYTGLRFPKTQNLVVGGVFLFCFVVIFTPGSFLVTPEKCHVSHSRFLGASQAEETTSEKYLRDRRCPKGEVRQAVGLTGRPCSP